MSHLGVSEERRREIRQSEVRLACEDIADALGLDRDGLYEKLAWVFWEYGARVRQRWSSRDFEAKMREAWREILREEATQQGREAKVRRLIDHPATSQEEREAAERALARLRREAE